MFCGLVLGASNAQEVVNIHSPEFLASGIVKVVASDVRKLAN